MPKLLYIDSSYTLVQLQARGLGHVLQTRFLDGLFEQVWSAHPVDTNPTEVGVERAYGKPLFEQLDAQHVFVRGRYGRWRGLAWWPALNSMLALAGFIFVLIRLVRREHIRVIRVGDPLLCGLIGTIVAKVTGARVVVRISGNHDMIRAMSGAPLKANVFRTVATEEWVEEFVIKRASSVIAPSGNYREFAIRKGAPEQSIFISRYGNLIDERHLLEPRGRPADVGVELASRLKERPWLVYVGRLKETKLAADCYDVLKSISDMGLDAGLLLIGDGPLRETIASRAERDGLSSRVYFMGNICQAKLASVLPHCSVALSPLTGRALAEMAFAALPIVAYDLDWQSDIVEDDVTGALVPANDKARMADAAARLLSDSALARRLGLAARERALTLLDPVTQNAQEVAAYRYAGVGESAA